MERSCRQETETVVPLKPVINGKWEKIIKFDDMPGDLSISGSVVDHCFFRSRDGNWQAWVQVRDTPFGRLFYRWKGNKIFSKGNWTPIGICWRVLKDVGESVGTPEGGDIIQAPYVLQNNGRYLLVYGGGPIDSKDHERQICIAESEDGITFSRVLDKNGQSRIVTGPRHAADAFLLKYGQEYLLYAGASYMSTSHAEAAVTLRRSRDLVHWSQPKVVHSGGICGTHTHSSQSVFVLHHRGFFYLFKMGWSNEQRTAVYRSQNPDDFGQCDEQLLTVLAVSAPEIINENRRHFISSLILPGYSGVRIAELGWMPDVKQDASAGG